MRLLRASVLCLIACALGTVLMAQQPVAAPPYDLVIQGGQLADGSGNRLWQADVAVRGDRIAAIGELSGVPRKRTIDAKGLVVAPGFIDMHNHSDNTLLDEPKCESMIRQGVTTMVLGEGASQGPVRPGGRKSNRPWTTLGGYFDLVDNKHAAANICSYVGETQVWTYVKGEELSPATPAQIEAMKEQVALAMKEGAMGLATSLLMPPSNLITTAQLIDLAKVARQYGGIYATHMRDEGSGVFRSMEESINIGKGANIRVDIIHLKIADKKFWGQSRSRCVNEEILGSLWTHQRRRERNRQQKCISSRLERPGEAGGKGRLHNAGQSHWRARSRNFNGLPAESR
jgi:N-acyl-D-amino-acid deacylase